MKKVDLPSGAKLEVDLAPFRDARALYMVALDEMKALVLDPTAEVDVNFLKGVFCTGLASKKIEEAIWVCMKRALYNGIKISEDTFESADARQDYIQVCMEVAVENIAPFMKSLSAQFADIKKRLPGILA